MAATSPSRQELHNPSQRHRMEDFLARPVTRRVLRLLARKPPGGRSLFQRICEGYGRNRFTTWLVNLALDRARLDREEMRRRLFHHVPTVKSLDLTFRSIGRYGLAAPQRFVAPLMVVWNFTQACNLSCVHCYQQATRKPQSDELALAQKLDVIAQLANAGVPFLTLAGGEPLVSPDLWPVLEAARRRGFYITLATNGTLLTPAIVARLKRAGVDYLEVSVDSLTATEHDGFRGQQGAWARTVQGIRNAVDGGIRTGLAACLTHRTAGSLDDMIHFAAELGCHTFTHFNFIPVGRGTEISASDLEPTEREALLQKMVGHIQQGRVRVLSTAPQLGRGCIMYAPTDGVFATGHAGTSPGHGGFTLARYIGGCGAGRCYCAIQPNGIVTPCVYISGVEVGDLRQRRFADIWDNELFATLSDRDQRTGHCKVCEYRAWCGGCRARAKAYFDDLTASDPGCIYNEKLWQRVKARAAREPDLVPVSAIAEPPPPAD
jgi:radical SAM protein with 4Fe4S-binding SPASM domain